MHLEGVLTWTKVGDRCLHVGDCGVQSRPSHHVRIGGVCHPEGGPRPAAWHPDLGLPASGFRCSYATLSAVSCSVNGPRQVLTQTPPGQGHSVSVLPVSPSLNLRARLDRVPGQPHSFLSRLQTPFNPPFCLACSVLHPPNSPQ